MFVISTAINRTSITTITIIMVIMIMLYGAAPPTHIYIYIYIAAPPTRDRAVQVATHRPEAVARLPAGQSVDENTISVTSTTTTTNNNNNNNIK